MNLKLSIMNDLAGPLVTDQLTMYCKKNSGAGADPQKIIGFELFLDKHKGQFPLSRVSSIVIV